MYKFLDVGSRYSIDSCFPPQIKSNAPNFKRMFDFYGIEPEKAEYNRLKNLGGFKEIYNVGLYDTVGDQTLYITNGPGKASILKPDLEIIKKHYSGNINDYRVNRTQNIQTTTIDILFPNINFDVIKVDVQGVEYEIFKGGESHITNCTSIWTETSTVSQYKGQVTHDELVNYLGEFGFKMISRKTHKVIPVESDVIFLNEDGDKKLVDLFKKWFKLK